MSAEASIHRSVRDAGAWKRVDPHASREQTCDWLRRDYPDLTIAKVISALVFSQPTLDRIAAGLRKAGLPED